jgi:hypothetical protein
MSGMYNQINYTSNYKKIIEVEVNHDYFKDNKCISFLFKPTGETLSLFKNYGILFKKTQSGFVLISGADLRFSSAAFNGPIEVEISMSNNDPVFLNYSEISPSTGEGLLFQNSFEANTLHQEEYVDASVLTPINSSKLIEGTIKLSFNQNNEFFGEGSENSNAVGEKYRINFKSREVVVRYNFYSSKDNLDFSNFFIADDENSFKNDTIEKRNLANGQEVFCIQHPSPLKLSQFYDKSLFLKKEDGFLNTFSIQLPQPDGKECLI